MCLVVTLRRGVNESDHFETGRLQQCPSAAGSFRVEMLMVWCSELLNLGCVNIRRETAAGSVHRLFSLGKAKPTDFYGMFISARDTVLKRLFSVVLLVLDNISLEAAEASETVLLSSLY